MKESNIITEDVKSLAQTLKAHYQFFEGRTFLITGAFGFLGQHLVRTIKYLNDHVLQKKAKALLLDNFIVPHDQQEFDLDEHLIFIRHDVIKPFHTDEPIDYIIHAAGIASPPYYIKFPIETIDVGATGTRNMLELAREKNVKSFIFMSSSEVYGDPDSKHVPTKEDYNGNVSITGPRACYDESKRFGETMCLAFWRVFKIPVKIARPFNVYGPGIRAADYRVLPNFIEHAFKGEPLKVHRDGTNTRSFCYVNDEIEALFKLLFSKANGECFNVGNPDPEISVADLAHLVVKSMPFPVKIEYIEPPHDVYASSDPKRRCPDISKLQSTIDFKPQYDLNVGLKRTIEWFRETRFADATKK